MNDLSFHIPSAGSMRADPSAPNPSAFSHLHLVGNPDWTSSFSTNQHVAAARPTPAPPAPVALGTSSSHSLAAPAAIDAPAPMAKKSFLSMFYGVSSSTGPTKTAPQQASGATSVSVSMPPKALDALDTSPRRAFPVDVQLSMESISKIGSVDALLPAAPRREPPRPMALGSDTWNALSSVPLPRKSTAGSARQSAPPASIDAVSNRAPKPLWSDLSFSSRFRNTAPTLEAFQNVPPAPISSTPPGSFRLQTESSPTTVASTAIPVPPKPLTTSPLRDDATSSREQAVAEIVQATHRSSRAVTRPLVPVGEETLVVPASDSKPRQDAPVVSSKSADLAPTSISVVTPPWEEKHQSSAHSKLNDICLSAPSENPLSLPPTEFTKSISSPATQQSDEVRSSKNIGEFIRTLFRRGGKEEKDSLTTESKTVNEFNALEMVTGCRSTWPKASNSVDYSNFFSTSLFDDECEEDSEESLEKLRRILGVVMQSAQNTESSSVPQPTSQGSRRSNGGDNTGVSAAPLFPTRYTGFSASYQTTNNTSDSDWMQFARF